MKLKWKRKIDTDEVEKMIGSFLKLTNLEDEICSPLDEDPDLLPPFLDDADPDLLPSPLRSLPNVDYSFECGGGDGGGGRSGGGGSWKGFGWGGFDGRKRRVNKKLGFWFWGFTAVCCLGFWALILGGELELGKDLLLGALCLSMFLVLLRNGCVPEWLLGFCSGAAVVGLSIHKRDELQRLIKGFKAMGIARRRQKGRRTI